MRYLALDLGEKRIGVAVSDEFGMTAQPLGVIERSVFDSDVKKIRKLIEDYNVHTVVIGLPRNMDGSLGPQAVKALEYAAELRDTLGIKVVTWDERLTTQQVEKLLISADVRRKGRKKVVDKLAAALILEGYLAFKGRSSKT